MRTPPPLTAPRASVSLRALGRAREDDLMPAACCVALSRRFAPQFIITGFMGITIANDWLSAEIMKALGVGKGRR